VRFPETNAKGTLLLSVIVWRNWALAGTAMPANKHETPTANNITLFIAELLVIVNGCFR
jgi:hypothetical protein